MPLFPLTEQSWDVLPLEGGNFSAQAILNRSILQHCLLGSVPRKQGSHCQNVWMHLAGPITLCDLGKLCVHSQPQLN